MTTLRYEAAILINAGRALVSAIGCCLLFGAVGIAVVGVWG